MALTAGSRIGPYEIVSPLGAGGMGEVYRARDARLGRDVAIKVLSEAFASDPDRIARFQREAHVLASLSHPHIAAIYGLEAVPGADSGLYALVLEFVDGETLADRLARGPLPLDEALGLAAQIASALEAAHELGIVHRDLKPSNIAITAGNSVKVLDFGIAKLAQSGDASHTSLSPSAHSQLPGQRDRSPSLDQSMSPTITSPALITGAGTLLGTAAYMSPEQAKGRPADKRSDIWALGCVIFEMLTGARAFEGDDVSDTLALVLTREPAWNRLPARTPASVVRLLRRALQKDRRKRLADAADARLDLEDAALEPAPTAAPALRRPSSLMWLAAFALAAVAAAGAAGAVWLATRPLPEAVTRLTVAPAAASELRANGDGKSVAVTPNGRRLIYRGNGGRLFLRSLDALEPAALSGLGDADQPVVSPDGDWVAFFDGLTLKKIALTGGPATTVCRLDGAQHRGLAWGSDGTMVFATSQSATGLQRVSADGGAVTVLTRPDREKGEGDHVWPSLLPGGRAILFTILPLSGALDSAQVALLNLDTGAQTVLIRGGSDARYLENGRLVYLAGGTLRAVPFDLDRLETSGTAVEALPRVRSSLAGGADFDVSPDGMLVYVSGTAQTAAPPRTLAWVDRQGRETAIPLPPRMYAGVRISPDGTRIALDVRDQEDDLWVWDIAREALTRLTFGPSIEWFPVWSRTGTDLFFGSNVEGPSNIYRQAVNGTGAAERITTSPRDQLPGSITPDGSTLLFDENSGTLDVASVTTTGTHQMRPVIQTDFEERYGSVSPDGRWLAYQSNETGDNEIFVRPYPNIGGGRWQVSNGGGNQPLWAPSGTELYFQMPTASGGRVIMRVRADPEPIWSGSRAEPVFEGTFVSGLAPSYDISPDGRRFVVIKPGPATQSPAPPSTLVVVQNWDVELRRAGRRGGP